MAPATRNTFENPRDRARMVGSMEPRTEAHPLAAQAHGIRGSLERVSILTPRGKGIPMRRPKGAMMTIVAISLAVIGRPRRERRTGETRP